MSTLNELFKQLEVHSANAEHADVYDQALDILKSAPHDSRALRLTIVSLIHMDRYLEAHRVLKQYGAQADPGNTLLHERLYVLYKLNLNDDLRVAFDETPLENNRGLTHLKAQFLYRQGHYTEALKLYQQLIAATDSTDPLFQDLSVNERAVLADGIASGSLATTTTSQTPMDSSSYDLLFNEACIRFALDETQQALDGLDEAERLCREQVADASEQKDEVALIILQRAFILSSLGQHEEAAQILKTLEDDGIEDELSALVLSNNLIATSQTSSASPLLLLKELGFPNKLNELSARISSEQRCIFWKNYYRLATRAGKRVQGPKSNGTDIAAQVFGSLSKAGVSFDDDDLKSQAKRSLKYAFTSGSVPSALAAAQMNIDAGNLDAAVTVLENLTEEQRLIPGVCGALLSLYDTLGSEKKSSSLFTTVTSSFEGKTLTSDEHTFLTAFLLHFLNRPSTSTQARDILTSLNNTSSSSLIQAALDPSATATDLTPLSQLNTSSTETLIAEATTRLVSQSTTKPHASKVIKKRARKPRHVPSNVDLSKSPDAERWLPMKDRSYYKPKKGKKAKARDTQGGSADNITEEAMGMRGSTPTPVVKGKKKKGKK